MKDLVGLYFVRHDDEGFFQTGKIVAEAKDDHYFATIRRKRAMDAPAALPMELYSIHDFTSETGDGQAKFEFFDTEEALDAWSAWLIAPEFDAGAAEKPAARKH